MISIDLEKRMGKKEKKVKFFVRITRSFLGKAFSAFKVYCLQSMGFSTVKKSL